MTAPDLDALVRYYETLDPQSLADMGRYYADDCYFKDPFNEVHRLADIQALLLRMYRQLHEPRFRVTRRIADAGGAALAWDFDFRIKAWRPATVQRIHGATLLRFDAAGKVVHHRDYWDAAEELYEKLPGIGVLMRVLRRCVG
jgi:steroid delta-isomerase